MKVKIFVVFFLLYSSFSFANDFPESIDFFSKTGLAGKFVRTQDPGFIVIELDSGEIIEATYSGIEWETLWDWKKEAEATGVKRAVKITYTNTSGIGVLDPKTGIEFNLGGAPPIHPIDIAGEKCEVQYPSTIGISACKQLVLGAWEYELHRAYTALGGDDNVELNAAQSTWIEFRDKQTTYLQSEYGARSGSIWGNVYMSRVVDLTREQAIRLLSIKAW